MLIRLTKGLFFIYALLVVLYSCSENDPVVEKEASACEILNVSYAEDILPVVKSGCSNIGCHVENFSFGNFLNYEDLKTAADNGSLWLQVGVTRNMPPTNTLYEEDIINIQCWIENGALNN